MKRMHGVAAMAAALLALGVAGCGGATVGPGPAAGQATRLNAGGSSFVYPMMQKWASEYDKAGGVQVNYQSISSGGGIQQMTAKTFDFGCTDAPMNDLAGASGSQTDQIGQPPPTPRPPPNGPGERPVFSRKNPEAVWTSHPTRITLFS